MPDEAPRSGAIAAAAQGHWYDIALVLLHNNAGRPEEAAVADAVVAVETFCGRLANAGRAPG